MNVQHHHLSLDLGQGLILVRSSHHVTFSNTVRSRLKKTLLCAGEKPQGSVSSDAPADTRVGDSRSATSIGGENSFCQYQLINVKLVINKSRP